jgi:hypothetical protein
MSERPKQAFLAETTGNTARLNSVSGIVDKFDAGRQFMAQEYKPGKARKRKGLNA